MANDSMGIEIVETGLQRRLTQAKDRSSLNGDSNSNADEPNHRRDSSMNIEREEREESWSVDEEHWENVPPRANTETSSNSSDGDSEDTPLPLERNMDQCRENSCQADD
ncbi:hypothetical protein L6164_025145 [Bauhinia variegata]|uniref:Uncharacterized protein n=1 Tax=Bauhinia variegata TaxID=167791 RepID=A0ACB9M0N7_BAUVA|nr:hypothetical protein L6164_025145 [Bauhinia variegata]